MKEYKSIDKSFEFGFIVAVDAFLGDNLPLDNNLNAITNVIKAQINGDYCRAEFVLLGDIWDNEVELKENEKILVSKVDFLMCAYSYTTNNGTQYIQNEVAALESIVRVSYEKAYSNVTE